MRLSKSVSRARDNHRSVDRVCWQTRRPKVTLHSGRTKHTVRMLRVWTIRRTHEGRSNRSQCVATRPRHQESAGALCILTCNGQLTIHGGAAAQRHGLVQGPLGVTSARGLGCSLRDQRTVRENRSTTVWLSKYEWWRAASDPHRQGAHGPGRTTPTVGTDCRADEDREHAMYVVRYRSVSESPSSAACGVTGKRQIHSSHAMAHHSTRTIVQTRAERCGCASQNAGAVRTELRVPRARIITESAAHHRR